MRLITKLWATLLLLCVAGVASAATEYEVDQKFTSVAALEGQLFAIVNETDGKAIYNKDAQNLAYDTYANAIAGTAYLYKLHSLAEESDANVQNAYAIEVVKADGSSIGLWGNPAIYLNSGAEGGFDGCFVLGNKDQYGTDVKYGGAWEIEYAEGQGFALKNVARGGYFAGVNPAPTGTDPIYWTLCTMKEAPQTDPLADQKDALTAAIAKGKMFNALAYTDATFTTLTTKIADGETALAAEGATAESLTAATTAINDAITALAFKEGFSSLKDVPFGKWDGWGADAQQTSTYNTTWELFKTTGQSYGDPGVNDYADLSAFDKLYVTVASGTPRILLNRDADNGQWNATEAESHLIDNTVGDADSWHQKYFAKEGNVYSVDLKQLTTDKGFAHLHSIKSRDNNVVTGLFLYKAPAAAVTTEVTFDFDGGNHAASSNSSHDGDITEDEILTQDGVTMTITPSGGSTANRYWGTSPKMRMYGGTMTIAAPEGKAITKVIYNNGKWNAANTINGIVAEKGEWTGNSTNVVLSVSANTQIKNVIVTVADKNDETTTFTPAEPVHIANTAETAYTVAEAIALIEAGEALSETVFVKGIISKIEKVNVDAEDATKNYITYWISADGTEEGQQFECFKGLTMEGVAYTDIKVGAEVIVKGILTKYQETYEFKQNNELVSYVAPVEPTETIAATLIKPTTGIATEFTSVADLTGVNFAIINKEEGKALYGSNNQNLAYDTYASAFSSSNSGYLWKLVSLADDADADVHEYYRFQLITPTGADYNCWGMGGWLNSQPANKDCSFILGLDNKNGQDIKNGAVYDVQYVEGKGFTIKNIGTGLYQGANNGPAKNEEPTYFTFATVSNTYVPAVEALLAEGAKYKAIVKDEAALTAYNTAIAGIDVTAITGDGLEEAKKVDAAITELAKAVPAVAGQVYTRTIVNPSFEFGNIDGWTSKDGGNSANNGNFHQATGSFFVEKWTNSANGGKLSDGSLTQVIAGLPAGKYKLTAEMQNLEQGNGDAAGKGFYLIANTDSMAVAVSGETVTVETELARKADLTIGAVMKGCTGNWVCVDNFQLTLVEPAPIPTLYAITIAETQNGTVTANDVEAAEGEVVTLTAKPAEGYIVDEAHVVYGENQEAELTINEAANTATFTMPASAVTVTITFKVDPIVTAKADLEAAITAAKAIETEGKNGADALATAITDAETALNAADATVETLAAAKVALAQAISVFNKANLDANLIEIAQSQSPEIQDGANRADVVEGDGYNQYTTKGDISVIIKMMNIDVKNCDYVVVKFAEPVPAGISIAFWNGNDNVTIPEGATEYKYVFAEDNKCAIANDVLPQICILTLWNGGKVVKIEGVYKHQIPVEITHTWDFTKWSEATVANLKADAAASKIEGWSDVEKKADAEADVEPTEASKDNCFWAVIPEGGELKANGEVIEELKGLQFGTTFAGNRSLAIAVNYAVADASKDFGPYNGPAYLWLGGAGFECFTIPAVKGGTKITMGVESHKITDARGVQLFAGETELKDADGNAVAAPKTYTEQTWAVPAGVAYDIVVKNTKGCHIYFIDAEQDEATLTSINTVKSNVMNNAIYNLNGQKVNKAQKGLFIINGKKVVK
jgi:hypothetical protein